MKCYNLDGCAEKDAEDARRTASRLDIPFYVFDFEKEYKDRVVDYMIRGYRDGVTPNPDVMCNKEIKFGLFLENAVSMGADFIATGHYVCLRRNFQVPIFNFQKDSKFQIPNSKFSLWQAKDREKDQSYFLWGLTQEHLRHCLFPIGKYLKPEVREIARRAGLPTAEKKDSQGICFLGKFSLYDFLKESIPEKKGDILNEDGGKIGEHNGAWFYTIGQRHIGFGDHKKGAGAKDIEARYVAMKDIEKNALTMVRGGENPFLYGTEAVLQNLNFIRPIKKKEMKTVFVRVRYRGPLSPSSLDTLEGAPVSARVSFKRPQKIITPGKSAVIIQKRASSWAGEL